MEKTGEDEAEVYRQISSPQVCAYLLFHWHILFLLESYDNFNNPNQRDIIWMNFHCTFQRFLINFHFIWERLLKTFIFTFKGFYGLSLSLSETFMIFYSLRLSWTPQTLRQVWERVDWPAILLKRSEKTISDPRMLIISSQTINTPLLQTFFEEFESPCNHGFFNRGDLDDPAVAACVDRGLENLLNFVTEYVLNNWMLSNCRPALIFIHQKHVVSLSEETAVVSPSLFHPGERPTNSAPLFIFFQ